MSEHAFDVAVIGGGPVGGLTAWLIAKSGYKVAIIEEHEEIGEPVQCAGLITPRCFEIVNYAKKAIINEVKGADFYSPGGQKLTIGKANTQAVVIDRALFDSLILDNAVNSGAVLHTGKRLKDLKRGNLNQIILESMTLEAKLVIGADGARSMTRKLLGLEEPHQMLNGFGADIERLDIDQEKVNVFFGRELAPNFFAWMIPVGDITRVGLCVRDSHKTVYEHFKRLFKAGKTADLLKNGKIIGTSSGIIPIGMPARTSAERGMIVGDAASQVKATSGGGIYPGLVCARHCAKTAITALEKDDFSTKMLSQYHESWTSDLGDELKKAMMMHGMIASLSDEQLEDVFKMLSRKEIIDIINNVGDIDYPSKLGWMLLRKEPGLLKYAGKFLKFGLRDF